MNFFPFICVTIKAESTFWSDYYTFRYITVTLTNYLFECKTPVISINKYAYLGYNPCLGELTIMLNYLTFKTHEVCNLYLETTLLIWKIRFIYRWSNRVVCLQTVYVSIYRWSNRVVCLQTVYVSIYRWSNSVVCLQTVDVSIYRWSNSVVCL